MSTQKTHSKQSASERRGIAAVAEAVSDLDHIWRETTSSDIGIDGLIELVDSASRASTGIHIGVQVKARQSAGAAAAPTFLFGCRPKDVDYWLKLNLPVLLIVANPDTKELWAKDIRAWFTSHPENRSSGKIVIDRDADRLTDGLLFGLLDQTGNPAADSPGLRSYTDQLVLNMVEIQRTPTTVYCAPTSIGGWPDVLAIFDGDEGRASVLTDVVVQAGKAWSVLPFDGTDRSKCVDGPTTELRFDGLVESDERLATRLLYGAFRAQTVEHLRFVGGREPIFYFRLRGDQPRREKGVARGSGRTVVTPFRKKDGSGDISHFRHFALRVQILRLDDTWYLTLQPDYHFTIDGERESRYSGEWKSGMAFRERHTARRDLLRFWAAWLRRSSPKLGESTDLLLHLGELIDVELEGATVDDGWAEASSPPDHEADETPSLDFDAAS